MNLFREKDGDAMKSSVLFDVLGNFREVIVMINKMFRSQKNGAFALRAIAVRGVILFGITKRRQRSFTGGTERLQVAIPVNPKHRKQPVALLLRRAALLVFVLLLGLAFPLNVPAQESKGIVAEQKTDRPACDEAGNDHASQVGIGKPVGNRDGRINRVHFIPPLWIVIGASLAFGVIVGIIAGGIAFNVIAFILDFKERKK